METIFDIYDSREPFEIGIEALYDNKNETIDEAQLAYGHLWSEFYNKTPSFRNKKINEAYGYISGIQNAMHGINRKVFNECEQLKKNGDTVAFYITEKDFPNVNNKFFDILRCTVTIIKSHTRACECEYVESESGKVGKKTIITLRVTVYGTAYEDIIDSIKSDLSHELIHAYQDITMRNDGNGGIFAAHKGVDYNGVIRLLQSENKDENALGCLLYNIHDTERNANIGQTYAELEAKKDSLTDVEHIMDEIKNTEYARQLRVSEKILDGITNEPNIEIKKVYLNAFNKVSGITTTKYRKMIQYLKYILNRAKSHYYKQASKMAYDIYAKNAARLQAKPHQKQTKQ